MQHSWAQCLPEKHASCYSCSKSPEPFQGEQCVMQPSSIRRPDLIYGAPDAIQKGGISVSRSPLPHLSRQATSRERLP